MKEEGGIVRRTPLTLGLSTAKNIRAAPNVPGTQPCSTNVSATGSERAKFDATSRTRLSLRFGALREAALPSLIWAKVFRAGMAYIKELLPNGTGDAERRASSKAGSSLA